LVAGFKIYPGLQTEQKVVAGVAVPVRSYKSQIKQLVAEQATQAPVDPTVKILET